MSNLPKAVLDALAKSPYITGVAGTLVVAAILQRLLRTSKRPKTISHNSERVLIIGATSGVGRKLASLYAQRGAKLCILGRRPALLEEVKAECAQLSIDNGLKSSILAKSADMTKAEDLVEVREYLQREWGGFDTLHICAGVSSLRPLLEIAGSNGTKDTSADDIKRAGDIAQKAITGNFTGPLLAAVTFIPQLQRTSPKPSILLISSVAALIPAPTRSLYCSSKSASLMLFRSLAIEHPSISFSYICPGTIEGNFRASAVDGGDIREVLTGALKAEEVASRCMRMVDGAEGLLLIPWKYSAGMWLSWFVPALTDFLARRKYNFAVKSG